LLSHTRGGPKAVEFLEIAKLEARYGETQVLWGVDMSVRRGEIVALIGANGAGKSTIMKTISGLLRPSRGSIRLDGRNITSLHADDIVRSGVAHVPEGRQVFGNLSVEENLLLGAYTVREKEVVSDQLERAYVLFPRLKERRRQGAATMSGGEQQMLAIARGLMSRPALLLLDEPSLGLAPVLVSDVFRALRQIAEAGTTLLLVEQNSRIALQFAHRAYVLETGRIALAGPSAELAGDPRVEALYLGGTRAPADPGARNVSQWSGSPVTHKEVDPT
jgi:branched-chain amino acid transport system ATP-binding protein